MQAGLAGVGRAQERNLCGAIRARLAELYNQSLALYPVSSVVERLWRPLLEQLEERGTATFGTRLAQCFFESFLRSRIGELPACRVFGPPGVAGQIAGLVGGILWDRVEERAPRFEIREWHDDHLRCYRVVAGGGGAQLVDAAVAALEQAIEAGFDGTEEIRESPDLESIREHPRFCGLVGKLRTSGRDE